MVDGTNRFLAAQMASLVSAHRPAGLGTPVVMLATAAAWVRPPSEEHLPRAGRSVRFAVTADHYLAVGRAARGGSPQDAASPGYLPR